MDEKNNPENPAKNSDSKISLKKIDSGVSVAPEIEPKRNPWCDILTPENQEVKISFMENSPNNVISITIASTFVRRYSNI